LKPRSLFFLQRVDGLKFSGFAIYDDRLYLIDSQHESCVYEYRIVEKDQASSV